MKTFVTTAGALALSLAVAGAAFAQPAGRAAVRQACMADFHKFCPDARPGPGGAIRACVKAHHSEFSQGCQSAIEQMRGHRRQEGAPAAG